MTEEESSSCSSSSCSSGELTLRQDFQNEINIGDDFTYNGEVVKFLGYGSCDSTFNSGLPFCINCMGYLKFKGKIVKKYFNAAMAEVCDTTHTRHLILSKLIKKDFISENEFTVG